VATGVVMSWLGAVRAEIPASQLGHPRYLIATPDGEQHGVGVWALELLLRMRGVGSLALGVSVPVPDLIAATRRHRPAGVVLSISRRESKPAAAAVARAIAAEPKGRPRLFLGGAAAVPPLPEGSVALPRTLSLAADYLVSQLAP
jgi:methanogenic corrinoid protein MtbC1